MTDVMQKFTWTEERVAELTTMWAGTMSAAEIGLQMGTSRCSVLGKAHRMNLPSRLADRGDRRPTGPRVGHMLVRPARPRTMRPAPKPKSMLIVTKFGQSTNIKVASGKVRRPFLPPGKSKTSPEYRSQFGMAPDMSVKQKRDVIAEAMLNTALLQAAVSQ
jgi:hypothetical protein